LVEKESRKFLDCAMLFFMVAALKDRVNENPKYEKAITYYEYNYPSVYYFQFFEQNISVNRARA
jgi:hypothetical protein